MKKVEDLTLEEVKEQMSLYQRLYYYKTKNSEKHIEGRRESKRKYYQKQKAKKEEQKRLEDEANGVSSEEQPKGNKMILQRKYQKDVKEAFIIVWEYYDNLQSFWHNIFLRFHIKTY